VIGTHILPELVISSCIKQKEFNEINIAALQDFIEQNYVRGLSKLEE
jgi:hypothetical protein